MTPQHYIQDDTGRLHRLVRAPFWRPSDGYRVVWYVPGHLRDCWSDKEITALERAGYVATVAFQAEREDDAEIYPVDSYFKDLEMFTGIGF